MSIATSLTVQGDPVLNALDNLGLNIKKEIAIVNWKVAKKTKSLIAKEVTKELNVTQKAVKAVLIVKRNSILLGSSDVATEVELRKTRRLPIKRFKPKQTREGVSYQISKRSGRVTIPSAFIIDKIRGVDVGHVYLRKGKKRLPIRKLYGPSPWGVHVINKQSSKVIPQINGELRKQLRERLRYQTLKKSGAI